MLNPRKYNFNCSVTANIQAEFYDDCGKTYTLAFAMVQPWKKPFGKAKALAFEAEYEIELEAGVTGT